MIARCFVGPVRRPPYVVISGLPSSGKSTLARALSVALCLPNIDKDDLLEALFEGSGVVGDLAWRRQLSRQADDRLRSLAVQTKGAVLTSWWRHPSSLKESGTQVDWLAGLPGDCIELHCRCRPEMAAARFLARKRHPGHQDSRWSQAALLKSFQEQAVLGPLGLECSLTVDTEGEVDLPRLLVDIERVRLPA